TNAHQEIAEIVSHTTRECAQSFQFPGMTQLHCPASIFYLGFALRRHIRNQSNAVPRFTGIAVDPSENALPQRNGPASGRIAKLESATVDVVGVRLLEGLPSNLTVVGMDQIGKGLAHEIATIATQETGQSSVDLL